MATITRGERLDARVTREEKEMIETAASLSGTSASDFIRIATRQAALNAIREHEVLTLNEEAKRVFVEALLNPPEPNEKGDCRGARRLKRGDRIVGEDLVPSRKNLHFDSSRSTRKSMIERLFLASRSHLTDI